MQLNSKAFTLVELLVVIAIIGLLASVISVAIRGVKTKARDAERKGEIDQIRKALEVYYTNHGEYPLSEGASSPNGGWSNSNDNSWNTLENEFGHELPRDPINNSPGWAGGGKYTYAYFSLGYGCPQQWYMLVYKLENPDMASPGVTACNGQNFNYGNTITTGMCQECH